MKKNTAIILVAAGALLGTWWVVRPSGQEPSPENPPSVSARVSVPEVATVESSSSALVHHDPIPAGLVGAGLNAAGGSAREDLRILQGVFRAWQRRGKGTGNPVGTNREITAALTGRNAWRLAFIPADHPAINSQGELCDRWGTPLHFHQLSGTRMEVRSNGPDRMRFTGDDIVL